MATDFKMTADNERLQAIKARRAAITPGEWEYNHEFKIVTTNSGRVLIGDFDYLVDNDPDLLFIISAPSDVDFLISEHDRLTAALDAANAEIAALRKERDEVKARYDRRFVIKTTIRPELPGTEDD